MDLSFRGQTAAGASWAVKLALEALATVEVEESSDAAFGAGAQFHVRFVGPKIAGRRAAVARPQAFPPRRRSQARSPFVREGQTLRCSAAGGYFQVLGPASGSGLTLRNVDPFTLPAAAVAEFEGLCSRTRRTPPLP